MFREKENKKYFTEFEFVYPLCSIIKNLGCCASAQDRAFAKTARRAVS